MYNSDKKSVYKGVEFQGNVGSLTISSEMLIFQLDAAISDKPPRSWLWKSMKRYQVIFSSDCPSGKRLLKFSNHQNKAVSFLVPEIDLLVLQEDINAKMDHGEVVSDAAPKKSLLTAASPAISANKAKDMMSKVQSIKAARQMNRRQTAVTPVVATNPKKATIKKSQSFDPATLRSQSEAAEANEKTKLNSSFSAAPKSIPRRQTSKQSKIPKPAYKQAVTQPIPKTEARVKRSKSESSSKSQKNTETALNEIKAKQVAKPTPVVKRSKSDSSKSPKAPAKKQPLAAAKTAAVAKESKMESSDGDMEEPKRVSKSKAALELAQELIVKPGQQAVKDYVVNPANNLIVVPANRNIVKPAKQTAEKIKPAAQKIIEPTRKVAHKALLPPKVIAEDMGLIKRQSSAVPQSATSKKPFLHFLKTPERRTFDDDDNQLVESTGSQRKSANLIAPSSA